MATAQTAHSDTTRAYSTRAADIPAADELVGIPRFTYASPVYFDELDPWRMLHNARYPIHVERANVAWYEQFNSRAFAQEDDPDQFVFIREWHAQFKAPMFGPGTMWVDIWLVRLGRSSSSYVFSCRNEDESIEYARGRKTIVKVDPRTGAPASWSTRLCEAVAAEQARAIADAQLGGATPDDSGARSAGR